MNWEGCEGLSKFWGISASFVVFRHSRFSECDETQDGTVRDLLRDLISLGLLLRLHRLGMMLGVFVCVFCLYLSLSLSLPTACRSGNSMKVPYVFGGQ